VICVVLGVCKRGCGLGLRDCCVWKWSQLLFVACSLETTTFSQFCTRQQFRLSLLFINEVRTPVSRVLDEKLIVSQLLKKFSEFMEPEGSLAHSQVPADSLYPEPAQSSP
jgi:hypothetical protein